MVILSRILSAAWQVWQILAMPLISALILGGVLYASGLDRSMGHLHWLVAAPVLYFLWLLAFLGLSALEMRWRFRSFEKPRYKVYQNGSGEDLDLRTIILLTICYYRSGFIRSLPLGPNLTAVPLLRTLALRAYAPRACIGENTLVLGRLFDPDLTEIGNDVVLGAGSVLTAHGVTQKPTGERIYISAPIRIGDRVTVGGDARIGMGVTIGADSIVEPGSNVVAFTTIPPGEVWGGNPAVFLRKRSETAASGSPPSPAARGISAGRSTTADVEVSGAARRLVTSALNHSPDHQWDSLEQFAIAAALHDGYGFSLQPEQIFQIRSLADVERIMRAESPTAEEARAGGRLPGNPELLPLLEHEFVTRMLARRDPSVSLNGRVGRLRVAIAASFTAEPLASSLKLWSRAFGIELDVEFCGFNQIHQVLLSPESEFQRNPAGLNVVLLRPEDLPDSPEQSREAVDDLIEAINRFRRESAGRSALAVGTLPPPVSAYFRSERSSIDLVRAEWHQRLAEMDGIEIFDFSSVVEGVGVASAADPALEAITRAPYSARVFQELGIGLARLVRRRCVPRAKVLALDCDGVLWGGVIAEDGPDGIQLGPDGPGRSFQLFQHALLELKRRGVLLVLVSRNEERDVFKIFDDHPGMILRREDLAAWRINWNPKSQGLREIADELNLGLDSMVFIDDDPVQRLHVESNVPEVTVFPTPPEPARYCEMLSKLWTFDSSNTTAEDATRTEMSRQERNRQQQLETATDLQSYLQSLNLVVEIKTADERDLPRVAQLTQKTNQFNLSLRRRTLEEIRALDERHQIFVLSARDRFGDYGLVGVCILRHECDQESTLEIDTFLLSCRALGRGVEQAFLHRIFTAAQSLQTRCIRAPFVAGPRNQPARKFFSESGFVERERGVFTADASHGLPTPLHVVLESKVCVG